MALYWPDRKVALQIDDDPLSKPYVGPEDWHVLHTSKADLDDFDAFDRLMNLLADALGEPHPDPTFRAERRKLFEALSHADTNDEGHSIVDLGTGEVEGWDDEVPEGSFETIEGGFSMCTPEFYYLREARKRTFLQEVQLAYELCGLYSTMNLSDPRHYRLFQEEVTSVDELRSYLGGARDLEGYRTAMRALDYVAEGSISPAASYLSILLTLPRRLGGYDLFRPKERVRIVDPLAEERAPSDEGRYEVYDLCWPRQRVVMQFVGDGLPSERERRALEAPGFADMFVVCVTTRQMADPEAFDEAARVLADRLGTPLPPPDAAFVAARDRLRGELAFPDYDHMRSMVEDWHWHLDK